MPYFFTALIFQKKSKNYFNKLEQAIEIHSKPKKNIYQGKFKSESEQVRGIKTLVSN